MNSDVQPAAATASPIGSPGARRFYAHTCGCGCGGLLVVRPDHRPNRIPRFLPGHNAKTGFERWAEEHRGKQFCECGCGETFDASPRHRREGFPRFKRGHAGRVAHAVTTNVAAWVREQQGKHLCACGCDRPIRIYPTYRWAGIPKLRRECMLRVPENHPRWKNDRTAVRGGRNGAYFVASVRCQVFERDGHRCRWCGAEVSLVADHVIPVWEGGDGSAGNGQVLCRRCHAVKTREERARRLRVSRHLKMEEADGRSRSAEIVP